ncbi:MAG: phosphatidylglycerophosphatase A [Candidatus Omnitrophica bacterium]|nr:phosphatidylglycerophosphatase A [Candidatus Omnitrophota bacterium]
MKKDYTDKMEKRSLVDKISLMLATLFGVGLTPLIPGTASCVIAVLVYLLIGSPTHFLVFTIFSLIISFPTSSRAEKIFKIKDCKKIVIDDFSGMLITLIFIPKRVEFIIPAFFLFRMLDMLKIPPADKIERFSGAKGIVGDDLVAGLYSNLILQAVRLLLKIVP